MTELRKLQTRKLNENTLISESMPEHELALEIGLPKMIALAIPEMQMRIMLQVTGDILVGRSFEENETGDYLDLRQFGAEDLGVSRKHLRLWSENGELFVEDLASTNGTSVNGVRLIARTPRKIRHADQIMLGKLELKVQFVYDLLS